MLHLLNHAWNIHLKISAEPLGGWKLSMSFFTHCYQGNLVAVVFQDRNDVVAVFLNNETRIEKNEGPQFCNAPVERCSSNPSGNEIAWRLVTCFFLKRKKGKSLDFLKKPKGYKYESRVNAEWQDVDDVDSDDMLHIGGGEYLNCSWRP